MKRYKIILSQQFFRIWTPFLVLLLTSTPSFSQNKLPFGEKHPVTELLDSLWKNPASFFNQSDPNWQLLCNELQSVTLPDLNRIKDSIFSGSEAKIKNESRASKGILGFLNNESRSKRIKRFNKKLGSDFRDKKAFPHNKVVLVEGDSWFEYPLFLKDITDNLMQQKNLAVYSLASGGDWVANMVSGAEYQNEYLQIKPDIFILSGGGNDIVGDQGISHFVTNKPIAEDAPFMENYRKYVILRLNHQSVPLCNGNFCPIEYSLYQDSMLVFLAHVDTAMLNKIVNGRRYLNKNFYRWLVTFKLEYKILLASLHKLDSIHFDFMKIITQGYDYVLPSSQRDFGMRLITKNGHWLQKPFIKSGITDPATQESVIMAMIFDFNEMLIEIGKEYNNIYHVDVRGFTHFMEERDCKEKGDYWFDEMHPTSYIFAKIAAVYTAIINNEMPKYQHIVNIKQFYKQNGF
jgi:hypothetical protein